ncbi:MAG: hypothetical protein ACRDD7_10020 [Peptostreptococcaceae bacterium]
MISMDVSHPDILDFINVKNDLDKITKANLSIKVTDKFMEAVILNQPFDCEFTIEGYGEKIVNTVNARELFMTLAKNNFNQAEPRLWAV